MKNLWFFVFLVISCTSAAQPAVKIYAYSRETTPGIIPKDVTNENGNPVATKKKAALNYYLFAAYSPSVKISFSEVWIDGDYYQVQAEMVNSPVVMVNNDFPDKPVKEVLVPATRSRVISIVPLGSPGNKVIQASWFRKMLGNSALIVSYLYKGKKYFISVKKIKPLLPAAGV